MKDLKQLEVVLIPLLDQTAEKPPLACGEFKFFLRGLLGTSALMGLLLRLKLQQELHEAIQWKRTQSNQSCTSSVRVQMIRVKGKSPTKGSGVNNSDLNPFLL